MEMVLGILAGIFVLIGLPVLRHLTRESKQKEKVYVNLENEIINIIQDCKETTEYGPGCEGFDTLLRIPVINIDEQKKRIEMSRVRSLIMVIEKVGWNCEYPKISMDEVSDLVEFVALTKSQEISCTLVRISRTNFLNDVYEQCFKERLSNPVLYLLKKGDDQVFSIYEKIPKKEIIADFDCKVSLSKETYMKYFSNELETAICKVKEKTFQSSQNKEPTKEDMLNELDLIEKEYNNPSFYLFKNMLSSQIKNQYNEIVDQVKKNGQTFKEYIYNVIGNVSGDWLESGKYHFYRGALNNTGNDLLKIFDKSCDLLLSMKAKNMTVEFVAEQKRIVRNNIKLIG